MTEPPSGIDIGEAVQLLRAGGKAARQGWHGRGMFLTMQKPGGQLTQAFVYLTTPEGDRIPWTCSQQDLLAMDWEEVWP